MMADDIGVEAARITSPRRADAAGPHAARPSLDATALRRDFPILSERINGHPLVWLDNAATTQKPRSVVERIARYYYQENSNIHRAAHELAARATTAYEHARDTVARFLGAPSAENIVFVRGTTEAINLVAQSWGRAEIGADDEIVVSELEHHSNIVPWQQLAATTGARLRVIPVDDTGQLRLDAYRELLGDATKLVAVTHVSNAVGTVVPVGEMVELAHRVGARVLVDGAQAVPHLPVDVRDLGVDFYAFSGHKTFGPTGAGALYAKADILERMPPWQGGGNMIADVTFDRTVPKPPPARFEAGTANIADAVGLGAAIEYLDGIGMDNVARHEHELLEYAVKELAKVPGLRLVGGARDRASILSFALEGHEPGLVGPALNLEGIAVRAGHHCAQPILRRLGFEATVRPSLALYNTCEDIDVLVDALHRITSGDR
jgi:cysteine desulfurase/selenocysteine lyase